MEGDLAPTKLLKNEGIDRVLKLASEGSSGWNRIESWLRNLESLKIFLEADGSAAPPSLPHGVYQIGEV